MDIVRRKLTLVTIGRDNESTQDPIPAVLRMSGALEGGQHGPPNSSVQLVMPLNIVNCYCIQISFQANLY